MIATASRAFVQPTLTSMPEVTLRKMRQEDLPRIVEILGCWNMAPVAPSATVPNPERSGILIDNTFVALADGVIVGVASYILHENGFAETASLAVDPVYRGAGIGRRLQDARLAELKARGVERLQTESDRPEVIDWYVKHYGYRVVGTNPKKHAFGLTSVDHWTVLELDLRKWSPAD